MNDLKWETKYKALKAKFMDSVDVAFRLGFEQGSQQAQQQAVMDQAAQAQAQMQQAQLGAPGQGNPAGGPSAGGPNDMQSEPPDGTQQPQPNQEPQENPPQPGGGSELDQHIGQLETMIAKGDMNPQDLMKAINEIKSSTKPKKEKMPFILSHTANHNLNQNQKQALSIQHEIVANVMKSFAEEDKRAANSVKGILAQEGLFKSEE